MAAILFLPFGRCSQLPYSVAIKTCSLHQPPTNPALPGFILIGIKIVNSFRNYLHDFKGQASPQKGLSIFTHPLHPICSWYLHSLHSRPHLDSIIILYLLSAHRITQVTRQQYVMLLDKILCHIYFFCLPGFILITICFFL